MNRISIHIQPFVFTQSVAVYNENGIQIYEQTISLNKISEAVKELAIKYNVHQVELAGSSFFTSKIQKEINSLAKYSKLDINVTVH